MGEQGRTPEVLDAVSNHPSRERPKTDKRAALPFTPPSRT
jgi:hypothetical protein